MPNNHAAQPEEDLVRLYLNDIGKYALLTKDDEARLAQAVEAGREARTEFATTERITPAHKRELRRLTRDGDLGRRDLRQCQLAPGGLYRQKVPWLPSCRCWTWCRRAIWV